MNIALKVEYDGTDYNGWQIQENVSNTIQQKIDDAIEYSLGKRYQSVGSGRTDTGVHASGQIVNIRINDLKIPIEKLRGVINSFLPIDIRVKALKLVDDEFNSRFDAVQREYVYNLCTEQSVFNYRYSTYMKYTFDFDLLFESADIFVGEKDFTTLSKLNLSTKTYICDVLFSQWVKQSENQYQYKIVANRFVYGMVRSVVGAMIDIARKKRSIEQVVSALEMQDRSLASPFAPASGLILNRVYYPQKYNFLNNI